MIIIMSSYISNGQIPGNQRGLYVNKFIVLNSNNDINNTFSILGNSQRENELLNYCDQNNITYITLFDVRKIFLGSSSQVTAKKTALSAFICKAKGAPHCIKFVGASVGGFGTTGDIIAFDETQTPSFQFEEPELSSPNYQVLSFVEDDIPPSDQRFKVAEITKDALRLMYLHHPIYGINSVPCSNGAPNNNIDIITTEWEFWNSGALYDDGILNNAIDYQDLINSINSARDLHNHSFPSEPVYVETYLGYLNDQSNPTTSACDIASWIDGIYTGTWANYRRVDRILAHYYNQDPNTVYGQGAYYDPRLKNFCESNNDPGESCDGNPVVSNDNTDYHPIFSSESIRLGSSPSDYFLGDYLTSSSSRNIFTVERDWYDDFKADNSDPNIHTSPKANDITPGAAQWFTQSYMTVPLKDPITFLSNTPICGSSGNQNVNFTYQGPIEQGIDWTFSLTDWQGNPITPSVGSTSGTTQDYNTSPLPSLPSYSLPINPDPNHPYTATLLLDYGNCSYTYSEKIFVTDHILIYALNRPSDYLGPISICEGNNIKLRVNQIAGASYQWKINGVDIQGATNFEYTASVSGDYSCAVSGSSCNGTSNILELNVTENPFRYIVITCGGNPCNPGGVNLTVYPNNNQLGGGDTYLWSTGSNIESTSACEENTYHVQITRNGCTRYQSQQVRESSLLSSSSPSTPSLTASPSNNVCLGAAVTLTSSPSAYVWSTGDAGSSSIVTYSPGVYFSVVRNSSRCQAVSNFITVTTNLVTPSTNLSGSSNQICNSDPPVTFTATVQSGGGTQPLFEWSTDGTNWISTNQTNTYSPTLAPGTYSIKVRVLSNAQCASPIYTEGNNAVSLTVLASPSQPATPTSNSPQCADVGVNLIHGTPPAGTTWYWQTSSAGTSTANSTSPYNVLSSGTYYLRALDANGCWSPAPAVGVTATVNPLPPTPQAPTSNSPKCQNIGVTLQFNGSPPAGTTWYWQTSSTGSSTANSVSPFTTNTIGTITYYVRARDNNTGCWSAASSGTIVTVTNNTAPSVSISSNVGNTMCEGPVTFTANSNGGSGTTFRWFNGTSWVSTGTTNTLTVTLTTGIYQYVVEMTAPQTSCVSTTPTSSAPFQLTVTPFIPLDLFIRDNAQPFGYEDDGTEPNPDNGYMWVSPDIWTSRTQFGPPQDPEYSSSNSNWVHVTVTNRGCEDYDGLGGAELHLNWAKASTALAWPDYWNGSQTMTCDDQGGTTWNNEPTGGVNFPDAFKAIPAIPAKSTVTLDFEWEVPNPDHFFSCYTPLLEWRHFCLVARILAPIDPMYAPEIPSQYSNTQNNNNIAWKNISIFNDLPGIMNEHECTNDRQVGGVIAIGNPFEQDDIYQLRFLVDENFNGKELFKQAEIKITLDDATWDKWMQNGSQSENIEIKREDCHQLVVTGSPAILMNLPFAGHERALLGMSFNFLTDEVDATPEFDYHVIQVRSERPEEIIGGELYRITKPSRYLFEADGGGDKTISLFESTSLQASGIGESAFYNWYDTNGNLLYSGQTYDVSPEFTKKYKLEIIAESDGFTSYDSVIVHVKEFEIINMNPNPTSGQLTIDYEARHAGSAYINIVQPYTSVSNNYIINPSITMTTINLDGYQPGSYFVRLICDGQIRDEKTVIIIQ